MAELQANDDHPPATIPNPEGPNEIILIHGTKEFRINRNNLTSTCSYFQNLLQNEDLTSISTHLELNQIPGDRTLSYLLEFLQTGKFESTQDMNSELIWNLIKAGDILNFHPLINYCADLISENLTPEDCLKFWLQPPLYKSKQQETVWLNFIWNNIHEICTSTNENFLCLSIEELTNLLEDIGFKLQGEIVCEKILVWTKHDLTERFKHLKYLLQYVKLTDLSCEKLTELLQIASSVNNSNDLLILICNTALDRLPNRHSAKNLSKTVDFQLNYIEKDCICSYSFSDKTRTSRKTQILGQSLIMTSCGEFLYFINPKTKSVISFNPSSNHWSKLPELSRQVSTDAKATSCKGKVYIGDVNVFQVYDPQDKKWSSLPKLNSGDGEEGFAILLSACDKIYAVGAQTKMLFYFNPDTNRRFRFNQIKIELPNFAVCNRKIYYIDSSPEVSLVFHGKEVESHIFPTSMSKWKNINCDQDLPFLLFIDQKDSLWKYDPETSERERIDFGFKSSGVYLPTF